MDSAEARAAAAVKLCSELEARLADKERELQEVKQSAQSGAEEVHRAEAQGRKLQERIAQLEGAAGLMAAKDDEIEGLEQALAAMREAAAAQPVEEASSSAAHQNRLELEQVQDPPGQPETCDAAAAKRQAAIDKDEALERQSRKCARLSRALGRKTGQVLRLRRYVWQLCALERKYRAELWRVTATLRVAQKTMQEASRRLEQSYPGV